MPHNLVRSALETAVDRGEVGVQVAAYLNGELIIDESIGDIGRDSQPVTDATLFPVFSVTKAITATVLHLFAERGLIEYSAPVATYWPEFAANGKEDTLVQHVLQHRAGIPQIPDGATTELTNDWNWITSGLAAMKPIFPPGTVNSYHSINWGWLVGEIVRRADPAGRSFSEILQEELCTPLDIKDLYVGIPAEVGDRVATLIEDSEAVPFTTDIQRLAMPPAVLPSADVYNRADVQRSCNPGAGGIMNARSAGKVFAMLANGGSLGGIDFLSKDRLHMCLEPREDAESIDMTGNAIRWIGRGGYWLQDPRYRATSMFGPGENILQHGGAGGSAGWADLDTGLAVAITHNRMFGADMQPANHPFYPLADAVRKTARVDAS